MATLEITYDSLRREVGRFLGYSRTPSEWTDDQATDVGDILDSGLRKFYWPFTGESQHRWSFLQPAASLTLESGTRTYDLPDDFGGMLEGFSYDVGVKERRVQRQRESVIRSLWAMANINGPPSYCAVRVKPQAPGQITRYEALFYPTPDDTYELTYRYAIEPPALDESNSAPLGGARHAETILEACLSAAEKTLDDDEGVHSKRFAECLAASVQIDREQYA